MPSWLKLTLTNGAVVGSVINLVGVVLFYLNPQFPREIYTAIVAVVNSIYAVFGVIVVFSQQARARALAKASQQPAQATPPERSALPPSGPRARDPSGDASTLGPDAASVHIGGNVQDSSVGAGGRDVDQR